MREPMISDTAGGSGRPGHSPSPLPPTAASRSAGRTGAVFPSGNADLGHLPQVEHVVDLV